MAERVSLTAFVTALAVSLYLWGQGQTGWAYLIWGAVFLELIYAPAYDGVRRWWDRHCDEHGHFQPRWLLFVTVVPLGVLWIGVSVTAIALVAMWIFPNHFP